MTPPLLDADCPSGFVELYDANILYMMSVGGGSQLSGDARSSTGDGVEENQLAGEAELACGSVAPERRESLLRGVNAVEHNA